MATTPATAVQKRERKGDRCAECDCRLPITARLQSLCRCGALYCGAHMHRHTCTFDYRAEAKCRLREAAPVIAPAKLEGSL